MPKMLEIRWHARGGQGAVTASKVLADAALESGKYVQSFPEYGSERMGAPIKAFNRISDEPIIIYSQVTDPDIVVVLDETLLTNIDVAEGLVDDGIILINTEASPAEIRQKIVNGSKYRIFTIDATRISRKHLGRRMPNTPTIGALTSLIDLLGSREIADSFSRNYSQKFAKDVVESNVEAILEAAEAVSDAAEAKGEAAVRRWLRAGPAPSPTPSCPGPGSSWPATSTSTSTPATPTTTTPAPGAPTGPSGTKTSASTASAASSSVRTRRSPSTPRRARSPATTTCTARVAVCAPRFARTRSAPSP